MKHRGFISVSMHLAPLSAALRNKQAIDFESFNLRNNCSTPGEKLHFKCQVHDVIKKTKGTRPPFGIHRRTFWENYIFTLKKRGKHKKKATKSENFQKQSKKNATKKEENATCAFWKFLPQGDVKSHGVKSGPSPPPPPVTLLTHALSEGGGAGGSGCQGITIYKSSCTHHTNCMWPLELSDSCWTQNAAANNH